MTDIEVEHPGFENLKIREAILNDVPLITSIVRRSFADVAERLGLTEENTPRHPAYMTEGRIREAMEGGVRFFILENGDEAVGAVAVEDSGEPSGAFYVERLSVLPGFRKRGVGSLLLQHAIDEAVASGARLVGIGIFSEQAELRLWYETRGFRVKGKKHFDHLPFTVTFMEMEV